MRLTALCALLAALTVPLVCRAEDDHSKTWDAAVEKAVKYCRKSQADDGSWGGKVSPGITGIVLAGLLKTGKLDKDDAMVEKALGYLEKQIDPKTGHVAGQAKEGHRNYVTCVNVMALVASGRPKYKKAIEAAGKFLTELQWDEGEGKKPADEFYGGAGYDSKSRPDLSNTQMFLDALTAVGVPKGDAAYKKAAVFVSRCQNLAGEHNKQPWASKIQDGSFVYTVALGGDTKVSDKPDPEKGLPGYGSMTYAGVKSLLLSGIDRKDERITKGVEWLAKNYTVERNPGMPKEREQWGLYYYYYTMAKCLDVMGEEKFLDEKKVGHAWRADLTAALAKRQREDGSWANAVDRWLESNPHLTTGYALWTLALTRPRK